MRRERDRGESIQVSVAVAGVRKRRPPDRYGRTIAPQSYCPKVPASSSCPTSKAPEKAAIAENVQTRWPSLAYKIASGIPLNIPQPMLLSGASVGADTIFGTYALQSGHNVVHFLGPRNEPSAEAVAQQASTLYRLCDELLDGDAVSADFERVGAARLLGKNADFSAGILEWRDSRRNILQVRSADTVYAVGYRMNPSVETPGLDIGGGTGWACQAYVDRFGEGGGEDPKQCRLFFYDDGAPAWPGCMKDKATHRRWSSWDAVCHKWIPMSCEPPTPSGRYAGIGATIVDPEHGAAAIGKLYS